jgi:hypothetical protein
VIGSATVGPGLVGQGPDDAGIALRLKTGGIEIIGAGVDTGTPVFIHKVKTGAGGNICATRPYGTVVDHPQANGYPGAIVLVTPNFGTASAGTAPPRDPVGVFYDDTNSCGFGAKWVIYSLGASLTPLVNNQLFNVLVVRP